MRITSASAAGAPTRCARSALPTTPVCSKHRYAGASRTMRQDGSRCNGSMTERARVERTLGVPRSRSADGRPGASGMRRPRPRLRAHPLQRLRARVPARVLLKVPLVLPQLPRQAPRHLGAVAERDAPCAHPAPAPAHHRRRVPARRHICAMARPRHGAVDGGVSPRRAPVVRALGPDTRPTPIEFPIPMRRRK